MPGKTAFTPDQLHVIAVISNPVRFQSRYRLYREFEQRMLQAGVTLWTCEVAFGDRPFEVTSRDNPRHLQLRTFFELWHKENMCNLLIQKLPLDAEYIACIDADVSFTRPDWPVETIHQLQHYYVVQMWHDAYDLGPDGRVIQKHLSLMHKYMHERNFRVTDDYVFGHPGYAWAYRREALDHVGGLLDTAILGSADKHMGLGLIGRAEQSFKQGTKYSINQAYYDEIMRWQERAQRYLTRDVGYVETSLYHYWHGKKKDRRYLERWDILYRNDYTPFLDLKRDCTGLYQLTDRSPALRDDIRAYFRARNEDSIDL